MQVIITAKEIQSSINMNLAIGGLFSRFIPEESKKLLDRIAGAQDKLIVAIAAQQLIDQDPASFEEVLEDLREEFAYQDGFTTVTIDDGLNMVIDMDSEKLCAVMDVLTEEIPSFSGLIFAAYGMMQSLKAISNRIGNRLVAILK